MYSDFQLLLFHLDDYITPKGEIVEDLGDDTYRLRTRVVDDDEILIDGEAIVLVGDHPVE